MVSLSRSISKTRSLPLALAALLPVLAASACEVNPAKASIAEIFAKSRKANLPVVLAHLEPGMPYGAAMIVEPDIMKGDNPYVRYRDGLGLHVRTDTERKEVKGLQLMMEDKDAPQAIASAWGEPIQGSTRGLPASLSPTGMIRRRASWP